MSTSLSSNADRQSLSAVLGGSAFIFACRVLGAVLTFATQLLLARWMGAEELGIYVLAFSWAILLSMLATAGFPAAALRFIGQGVATGNRGYIRGFVQRGQQVVLLASLAAVAGGTVWLWLRHGSSGTGGWQPMLMAIVAVPFLAQMTLQAGVANAFARMFLSFVPGNVIRPFLFLAVVAVLGLTGNSVTAASAMMCHGAVIVIVAGATTVAARRLMQRTTGDAPPQYDTRQWIRIAMPLMAVSLFTAYFPEVLVILTGSWLPSNDLAVFHTSYRIALLIAFGIFAVDAFTAPEAARLHAAGDWQTLQRVTDYATRLRFWGSVAAVLLLAAAGKWLLSLFGEDFIRGYAALMILALAQLVQAAVGPVTRLMSVSGHQDRCLVVFGCALVVAVGLVAVLVPRYGILGAAVAAFLDMALWSVWMRYLVVQYLGIRPSFI